MVALVAISSSVALLAGVPAREALVVAAIVAATLRLGSAALGGSRRGEHARTFATLGAGVVGGALVARLGVPDLPDALRAILIGRALGFVLAAAGASTALAVLLRGKRVRNLPRLPATLALGFGLGLVLATTSGLSPPLTGGDLGAVAGIGANALVGALVGGWLASGVPDRALQAGLASTLAGVAVSLAKVSG